MVCCCFRASSGPTHDRVQKADLQSESDRSPNQIALDETVIRINGQQFWLYAAADPAANDLRHVHLSSTTATALTELFLRELRDKHDVETAVFLVDGAQYPPSCTSTIWAPISDISPRRSERCRTDFPRTEAPNCLIFKLRQPRRTENSRKSGAEFRLLAQCSKLNTTTVFPE